jgi:hypothetical protein
MGRVAVLALTWASPVAFGLGEGPYGLGDWPESGFGNHRALVQVAQAAPAVRVTIPWRRRDRDPEQKQVIVIDAATRKVVANAVPLKLDREVAEFAFAPATVPGIYEFYYLPYSPGTGNFDAAGEYFPAKDTAAANWRLANGLTPEHLAQGNWQALPEAKLVEIQAREAFQRFDPMEVCATAAEAQALLATQPDAAWLLFPEDRTFPIRMSDDLPTRWLRSGPGDRFQGTARPDEFYTFQVGVWAARQTVNDLQVTWGDLRNASGEVVSAAAIRCFNLGGIDWQGQSFRREVNVAAGRVQALWFGMAVPHRARGVYQGTVHLSALGLPARTVSVQVTVDGQPLSDHGDADLWRLSRLRWLDSTIAQEPTLVPPFTPVQTPGAEESRILGRTIQFADTGLPRQITCNGQSLLAAPVTVALALPGGRTVTWHPGDTRVTKGDPVQVERQTEWQAEGLTGAVWSRLEFDGYLGYRVTLRADKNLRISDLRLSLPLQRAAVPYFMGLGKSGGRRPDAWNWKWDIKRPIDMAWMGSVEAGVQLKLEGAPVETGLPQSWANAGQGGCRLREDGEVVRLETFTGPRELVAGAPLELRFRLLITPFKPLDTRTHWGWRVGDITAPPEALPEITVRHLHHAFPENPYINYPFLTSDALRGLVKKHHTEGMKGVNLYYNTGLVSNYMVEMWPFRSLGTELFNQTKGMIYWGTTAQENQAGGGYPWLMEHLGSGYVSSWRQPLFNGETDASLVLNGKSRYDSFYLEGARWLIANSGINGIYFDGVGPDRLTMRRLARLMNAMIPGGGRRDAHLGNNYLYLDQRNSAGNLYMEAFPYLDSVWVGEGFDYTLGPDYWLVEVSGLPFGLPSEMLACSGTQPDYFRGMLFGMGYRPPEARTAALWRFWDAFGIQDATMLGWWDDRCPVKPSCPEVRATTYQKAGQALLVVTSWGTTEITCDIQVDYRKLGLDPLRVQWRLPAVAGLQEGGMLTANAPLVLPPRGGRFIVIETVPGREE